MNVEEKGSDQTWREWGRGDSQMPEVITDSIYNSYIYLKRKSPFTSL